jgi:hypothetical protein
MLLMIALLMIVLLKAVAEAFEGDWWAAEEELFRSDTSTRQGSERG